MWHVWDILQAFEWGKRADLRSGCTLWSHKGTRKQMYWWLARCMIYRRVDDLYGMAEQNLYNKVGCYR
jgi:hypothetical protein